MIRFWNNLTGPAKFIVVSIAILIVAVIFITKKAKAETTDYSCTVCYTPEKCEVLSANSFELLQELVISELEKKTNLEKVTLDCQFPKTVKGYTGYNAIINLKKP